MAKTEYTPEELGLVPQKTEYTPQELGLLPEKEEYSPEELGFAIPRKEGISPQFQRALDVAREGPVLTGLPMPTFRAEEKKPVEPTAEKEPEFPLQPDEVTRNPFIGLTARGAQLLGSGIEGVARVGESFGDYLEEKLPISGLSKEELESKRQLEPLFKWADSLQKFGKELNYQPSQKLGDIADNPATIVPFIAERIIASSPDMAAAVFAFPAYVTARTNEILNERLKNDKKELKDATVSDVAISAGAAVVESTLERFATKRFGAATPGATVGQRVGKETAFQAGTEGIEEGVSYLGGTAGTKKGVDYRELGEQMLEGAIVGGGLGATVQGGREGYEVYKERAADRDYQNAMGSVLQDKGFTFAPRETQEETVRTILDTAKSDLSGMVDSIKERLSSFTPAKTAEEVDEFDATVARYRELGLPYDEAVTLAKADFEGVRDADRLDTRAGEPGVPVPSEELGTTTGAPAAVGPGVGRVSETAAPVGGGEAVEPGTLAIPKEKVQQFVDAGKKAAATKYVSTGERARFTLGFNQAIGLEAPSSVEYIDSLSKEGKAAYYAGIEEAAKLVSGVKPLGEPPVPPGFTRVYHSGSAGEGQSGRFVSTNRDYASGYRSDLPLFYTDIPANDPRVNNPDYADQGVGQGFTFNFELTPEEATTLTEIPREAPTTQFAEAKPVTQGKPRGRKKIELTPEEAQAKAQARKEQQAAGRNAIRQAEKIQKVANEQFDETAFDTEEALAEGRREFNERRRQALEDAYALTVSGATKNNKAGKVAASILEAATPQERALAKERYDVKRGTARSEMLEATNSEENPAYNKFKTAANALSWIMKNGNEFESTLARRLLPFIRSMKVVIVRSPADLPTNYLRSQFEGAAGMYSGGVIYLDADGGLNNTVFLHEALHGATIDRINKYLDDVAEGKEPPANLAEAVEELNAVMKSSSRMYNALSKLGLTDARVDALERAGAFTDIKEFVAYGMSNPAMQEFLLQGPGMYQGAEVSFIDRVFSRFVQAIRKMFNMGSKHNSAMQDLIIVTDKLLAADFEGPFVTKQEAYLAKKNDQKLDVDQEKLRQSNNSTKSVGLIGSVIRNHGFADYKDLLDARLDAMSDTSKQAILYSMQTTDILRWKGDEVPALVDLDKLTQEMSTMRMRMSAAAAKKAEVLAKFIRKNGSTALSDTMHLARLKKVSPSKYDTAAEYIKNDPLVKRYDQLIADPNTDPASLPAYQGQRTQRINQINAVYAKWDALGKQKGGHAVYEMVRQYYEDSYNYTRQLLNEQIDKLPIDAAAKAKLLKSVRLMQERSVSNKEPETVTLDDGTESVGVTFETLPEDYFPFKRYGEYWLRVSGGPAGREFYLFESGTERNAFMARRARELGVDLNTDTEVFKAGNNIHELRQDFQDSSQMLQEMFKVIDEADTTKAPAQFSDDLKDQLYQIYLMTMPERSFRKQFLHAEKVTGFSADVLRNFKTSAVAYSNQLAKLKYGTEVRNTVQRARDTLDGMPVKQAKNLSLFVSEMAVRAEQEVNPPPESKVANRVNQFAFIMLLTSGASAATQMASIPVMVMPTLGQQYGYGKAGVKFAKYVNIFKSLGVTDVDPDTGGVSYTAPSIASSSFARDNPVLRRAFQEATENFNLFSLTNTSVITDTARTPMDAYDSTLQTVGNTAYNGITALFNGAERLSREMSFAMAFELEYEKTKNFEASVQKAVETTYELLGRYDNMNRPRILRNFVGKTAGQFKMYAVYMTSYFIRNGYNVFNKTLPASERAAAMQRLTGTLLMGGMFHGLVGMPLYSTITSTIDVLLDKFGDEEEKRKRRAKNPLTADNADLRFRYEWLPEHFGGVEVYGLDGRKHRLSEILEKGPISALTDINIGSRTSFDGLWWRAPKPGKNWAETAQNIVIANLGPGVSTGVNIIGGVEDINNGEIIRGLEKLVPAFFKGGFTAARFGKEGAETRAGDDMLKKEEISTGNMIATVIGYQPTRLARIQEKNFAFNKELQEAAQKRVKLLGKLNKIATDDEVSNKEVVEAINEIVKYNQRYPMEKFVIKDETIKRSLENYTKKRGFTIRGQVMDKKTAPYLMPATKAVTPLE